MYRVGLIGAGNMGRAMLGAWIDSGTMESSDIVVSDRDGDKLEAAQKSFGASIGTVEDAARAHVVVLAVKPQESDIVLSELKGRLGPSQVLLSIAAGLTLEHLRSQVGNGPSIVRAMPNMAARVRAAVSGYSVDPGAGYFDERDVRRLLSAIGEVERVDEKWMDLVTAVSGSGPAYFFYLTEALEEAAVAKGMDREVARTLARGTLWGAAKTMRDTDAEPGDLRRAVSSRGGTTLAALSEMDSSGFMDMVERAVGAAAQRAAELAN